MSRSAFALELGSFLACGLLLAVSPALAASAGGQIDANIFVNLSKKAVPSVVNISTLTTVKNNPYMQGSPEDMFRKFFEDFLHNHGQGGPRGDDEGDDEGGSGVLPPGGSDGGGGAEGNSRLPKAVSLGSGFIIDSSGLILTNNHVVAGADEIKIQFTEATDEKPTDGEVVGRDPEIDVALIRVKSKRQMVPLSLGDSDALEVGEYVIAVGNPFGQGHSVTHGIISAKGRLAPDFPLARYLQTDAPINPGNSGGPLLNLKGEVIGINNAIEQRAQGIGFAIPISLVKKVLAQLKSKGSVSRGYIGVLVNELTPEVAAKIGVPKDLSAPFVTNVNPGEPADKAGMKTYDVIISFNGKAVKSGDDLINAVTGTEVGAKIPVRVLRNGKEESLELRVGQRPGADEEAKAQGGKDSRKKKKAPEPKVPTGMSLETVTPDMAHDLGIASGKAAKGVVVTNVSYGSAADQAGLMRGDMIVEVDRKPVKDIEQFYSIVKEKKSYLLRVRRTEPGAGEAFTVVVLNLK